MIKIDRFRLKRARANGYYHIVICKGAYPFLVIVSGENDLLLMELIDCRHENVKIDGVDEIWDL